MRLAVIPARGGSKRIPGKNIKDFCGKPMIAWSIEAAINSGLFQKIIVSTDDNEVAKIAVEWGAEVPFTRPSNLSDDHVATTPVIAHATQWAIDQSYDLTAVCCIYATAPFIQVDDLKQSFDLLETGNWAYSFPATDYVAPIFRSFKKSIDGGLEMLFPEHFSTRSQDLPPAYHDAGQFYWGRPSAWIEGKRIFDLYSIPLLIPHWRVQDIDNAEDWKRAEMIANIIMSNVKGK